MAPNRSGREPVEEALRISPAPKAAQRECPRCGLHLPSNDDLPAPGVFRPWHVLHGRARVKSYVAWLGQEAHEWLLALYVDDKPQLLAVDTVARGDVSSCRAPLRPIFVRAHQLGASGYILVHNHPSGDATPSRSDIEATVKLARASSELGVPLLDHLIIAGDTMTSCGYF